MAVDERRRRSARPEFDLLDNVLRVNPNNADAAGALYRITIPEIEMEKRRARLRFYRDLALTSFWMVIGFVLVFAMFGMWSLTE